MSTSVDARSRVAKGVREGGRFTTEARTEADVALAIESAADTPDEDEAPQWGSTYSIPEWQWEAAQVSIEQANRRLEKAGITERFGFTWGESYPVKTEDGHTYAYRKLTLDRPVLSYDGWEFTAAVERTESDQMLVKSRPGVDLEGWTPDEVGCDHCGRKQERSKTYILTHQDGTRKQVGSTCMQAFLGIKPRGLWAMEWDLPGDDAEGGAASWGGAPRDHYEAAEPREVIALALVLTDGGKRYVSRSAAEWGNETPTSHQVTGSLVPAVNAEAERQRQEVLRQAGAIDQGTINEVLEVARNLGGTSDYARNMGLLAREEVIQYKDIGLLASAVSAWHRKKEEDAKQAAHVPPAKGFLGEVKSKIAGHKATVMKTVPTESHFGYKPTYGTMLILRSDTGHELKWAASSVQNVDVGDEITFTGGTVKDHGQYKDVDQTILTRVKYTVDEA